MEAGADVRALDRARQLAVEDWVSDAEMEAIVRAAVRGSDAGELPEDEMVAVCAAVADDVVRTRVRAGLHQLVFDGNVSVSLREGEVLYSLAE